MCAICDADAGIVNNEPVARRAILRNDRVAGFLEAADAVSLAFTVEAGPEESMVDFQGPIDAMLAFALALAITGYPYTYVPV